mgnify:FL=1
MKHTLLIGWLLCALLPLRAFSQAPQTPDAPLKLTQIERLLDIKFEDALLAREVKQRGLAFRLDERTLERLLKRGLGPQARAALWQQEEAQAFAAFNNATDDAAKRLALGQAFLQQHPQSAQRAQVASEVRRLELDAFKSGYQTFSTNPEAARLQQLLQSGQAILKEMPDATSNLTVTALLALATAKGTLAGVFQDLPLSQTLAEQAVRLLTSEPASAVQRELRALALGELYRAQALYLLRQATTEPDQALALLDKAAHEAPLTVGKEPLTFWLQALAREASYQRQVADLPNTPAERQAVCARLDGLRAKLAEDYTRVVALSDDAKTRALRDEASTALKKLVGSAAPCTPAKAETRPPTLTAPPAQRARKVKDDTPKLRTLFIRSKTVYLKPSQLEAALLKRPEFQNGDWRILRNEKEADLIVEVGLPFLTWNWTFELTQRTTALLLATGSVREATAGTAAPRLAESLLAALKQTRAREQTER